jgi:hypothetical protein
MRPRASGSPKILQAEAGFLTFNQPFLLALPSRAFGSTKNEVLASETRYL